MRALTILQPWASLIALSEKRYETRSWQTSYRGPLAIHASLSDKMLDVVRVNGFYLKAFERHGYTLSTKIPFGGVVCLVDLVDVIPVEQICGLSSQESAFGDYSSCRYAWRLENVRVLARPIMAKGKQGLWEWPVELESLEFMK